MKKLLSIAISSFLLLTAITSPASAGERNCVKTVRVYYDFEQVICAGAENERTVTKTAYYTVGIPAVCPAGGGNPPSYTSGGTGSGGSYSGNQGSGGRTVSSSNPTLINPEECIYPGCNSDICLAEGKTCTGSSVILANGTYNFSETDLQLPARGIPINWTRYYRSNRVIEAASGKTFGEPADGPLGFGWATDYFARIENGDTYIDGRGLYHHMDPSAGSTPAVPLFQPNLQDGLLLKKTATGYELEELGGPIRSFDNTGKLTGILDRSGNQVTLSYDLEGRLEKVIDTTGREALTFIYSDPDRRIDQVVDAAGRTIRYSYDLTGNLQQVDGLEGKESVYSYNSYHGIESRRNALGETYRMTYLYPDKGVVEAVIDPVGSALLAEGRQPTGHIKSFVYDFQNRTYYVTDYNGSVTKKTYNQDGRLTSETLVEGEVPLRKTEHLPDRIEKSTDSVGNTKIIKRDEWFNIVSSIDGEGNETRFTWNSQKRPLTITDPSGVVTRFEYDANGTRLLKKTRALGLPEELISEYGYDPYGQLTSVTRNGVPTTITYNDNGQPTTVTDPLGHISSIEYDGYGFVNATVDAEGHRSEIDNNSLGHPTEIRRILDAKTLKTVLTYDAVGNLESITDPRHFTSWIKSDFKGRIIEIEDPLNNIKTFTYNGNGKLTRITQVAPGDDRSLDAVTELEYDSLNRLIKVIDPEGNSTSYSYTGGCSSCGGSNAIPETITDPFGKVTTNQFDKTGKLKEVQTPLDQLNNVSTQLVRNENGRIAERIDAGGKTTSYQYDALGRVIVQLDANLGQTEFSYDEQGNLASLTDPEQNSTNFEYDLAGRKIKETRPLGQTTRYSYYKNGLLKTVKDAKGQITSYSYDKANRLIKVTYADNNEDLFGYDDNGNLTGWDNGEIRGSITYDQLNRKTAETLNYPGFSKTYSYTYDHRGNKSSYTGPQGIVHSYEYLKNDHLSKIGFDGNVIDLVNDKTRLDKIIYGSSGVVTDYGYNDNGWLESIATSKDATILLSRTYQFDPVGNIEQMQSQAGPTIYAYDNIYQLTAADHPEATTINDETYSYDKVGNRLTTADTTGSWLHNRNNELTDSTVATYGYDANGNTSEKTENGVITTYIYNSRNRLAQVLIDNIPIASYRYDPFGRRISKTTAGITTYYIYADEGLIGEYSNSGSWQKSYGWRPDGLWGTDPVYMRDGSGLYYYHNDHLGTPQRLSSAVDGTVVWSVGYQAFGAAAVDPLSTVDNNLRFPGQYFDAETGLHYNWNRTYDPGTGRYTQVDPVGFVAGDLNRYRYGFNSPTVFIDPTGEFVPLVIIGRVLLSAAAGAAMDAGLEILQNYLEGKGLFCNVGEAAWRGAVSGAIGFGIAKLLDKAWDLYRLRRLAKLNNSIPETLARVIPGEGPYPTLGLGIDDVFVTAADDIAGLNPTQIAKRLTIPESDTFTVIKFKTPQRGLASPINRTNPGFVGGGRTAGGAREFVLPNQKIPSDSIVEVIR